MVSVLELRLLHEHKGIPRWRPCKEPASARDIRDVGSIPGSGRSPGGGYGSPLQYSCLENSMDRGAWLTTVHEVAKSPGTTEATYHRPPGGSICP